MYVEFVCFGVWNGKGNRAGYVDLGEREGSESGWRGSGCGVHIISWVTENGEPPVGASFCSEMPGEKDFRD